MTRRTVCSWCGVALRPGDQRPDRWGAVCRDCGASVLLTSERVALVLPPGLRVQGGRHHLRVARVQGGRRGRARRVLYVAGLVVSTFALGATVLQGWESPRPEFGAVLNAYFAVGGIFLSLLGMVGAPAQPLRFGPGGVRRGREAGPSLVRAILVEPRWVGGRWFQSFLHVRVAYVDARWRRHTVAHFREADAATADALGRTIRDVVDGGLASGGAAPRHGEVGAGLEGSAGSLRS